MKTYGGVEVELHAFITTFDGDESPASHPCRFIPLDEEPY
jgi:hypothetical protein